jgi:hypothetical protein
VGRKSSPETRAHCAEISKIGAAKIREDFNGRRFGRLVGTSPDSSNPRYWMFNCDCGTVGFRARKDSVKSGAIKSCGCLLRETAAARGKRTGPLTAAELTGQRFGRLVVAGRAGSIDGHASWKCVCDCGSEREFTTGLLNRGDAVSCGCALAERAVVRPEFARRRTRATMANSRKDPSKLLTMRTRTAVHQSLRKHGGRKTGRLWDILGYGVDQLRDRLMLTIPEGYSWDDYLSGALHVDHIIPLSVFNFQRETDLDFRRAWALSNLQLLPAKQNIEKSAKLSGPFQPSLCL